MLSLGIKLTKPDFKSAMKEARAVCCMAMDPPITRAEVYSVYRSSKKTGMIFFRNTVAT